MDGPVTLAIDIGGTGLKAGALEADTCWWTVCAHRPSTRDRPTRSYLGYLAIILPTLVAGIRSGLALLYNDKAWGATAADYIAAAAWASSPRPLSRRSSPQSSISYAAI